MEILKEKEKIEEIEFTEEQEINKQDQHKQELHKQEINITDEQLKNHVLVFANDHLKPSNGALIYPPSLCCVFVNYVNTIAGTNIQIHGKECDDDNNNVHNKFDTELFNKITNLFEIEIFKAKPEYIAFYEKKCYTGWDYFNISHPKYIAVRSDIKIKNFLNTHIITSTPDHFINKTALRNKCKEWFLTETGKNASQQTIKKYVEMFFNDLSVEPKLFGNKIGYQGFEYKE